MTANKTTTPGRNSSNDQWNSSNADDSSSSQLANLTPKQQAIIIASLEHPDDPAVKIATRVGAAQSYPSQVVDNHGDVLNALRDDLDTGDSVVDVIERELTDQEIANLVEQGLLDRVDTRLTEGYRSNAGCDGEESTVNQSADDGCDKPVDRPVTSQRPFMFAGPYDATTCDSDGCDRVLDRNRNNAEPESTQSAQTISEIDTANNSARDGRCSERSIPSSNVSSKDELQEWYNALTKKQRVIVDTITKNPSETDTRIAEIASKKLPSGESVSRAYVSIIQSEDTSYVEALQKHRDDSGIESGLEEGRDPEKFGETAECEQEGAGTPDDPAPSQRSSIPVEELKRVRDRIAFSTGVIEHEYALQNTASSDGEAPLLVKPVTGTVAFARQTLAEIDELIEGVETS
jgi:hypothetical protein